MICQRCTVYDPEHCLRDGCSQTAQNNHFLRVYSPIRGLVGYYDDDGRCGLILLGRDHGLWGPQHVSFMLQGQAPMHYYGVARLSSAFLCSETVLCVLKAMTLVYVTYLLEGRSISVKLDYILTSNKVKWR